MAKKRKISNALSWIVKEAKKLKREYPKRFAAWKDYVAEASAIYKSKHGSTPVGRSHKKVGTMPRKKTATKRKRIVRSIHRLHRAEGRAIRKLGTVSGFVGKAKLLLEKKIGHEEVKRFKSKTKRARKKISKRISALKTQYRKLS